MSELMHANCWDSSIIYFTVLGR